LREDRRAEVERLVRVWLRLADLLESLESFERREDDEAEALPKRTDDRKTRALDAELRDVDAEDLIVAGALPRSDGVQRSGSFEEARDCGRGDAATIEIALSFLLWR